mmetsp:Transcript_15498/g.37158  ORF Transcript_15498/g.37158 Transcript_15498/m.37158 type:complete len:470 (-) Transcript_15498:29-1438(-)
MESIAICPILSEEYDHDPSTIVDKRSSHLPVQSSGCSHRICYSCLMKIKMERAADERSKDDPCRIKELIECPVCRKAACFDADHPIVDVGRCVALRILRGTMQKDNMAAANTSSSDGCKQEDSDESTIAPCSHSVSTSEATAPPTDVKPLYIDIQSNKMKGANDGKVWEERNVKEEDTDDSDDESRFSYLSDSHDEVQLDVIDVVKKEVTISAHKNDTQKASQQILASPGNPPIPHTTLISREKLHCITGGMRGNYKNPLGVGTPIGFCGGPAFATSGGRVHHICIKENMNHPLPNSLGEEFALYRRAKPNGPLPRDIWLLMVLQSNHPPIPIFWEPVKQEGSGVSYVGHWEVTSIDDYSNNPISYMGIDRCAIVKLQFVRFDQGWAQIIQLCHDKSNCEIKSINWGEIEVKGYAHGDIETKVKMVHRLNEKSDRCNHKPSKNQSQENTDFPLSSEKRGKRKRCPKRNS